MILAYIKGFLTLFLLIKVLLYFVPKKVFGKYIAFFSGVILVIGLLYPVMQFFGQEKFVLERLQQEDWMEQLHEILQEADEVEENGKEFLKETYMYAEEEVVETIVIENVEIDEKTQVGEIDE